MSKLTRKGMLFFFAEISKNLAKYKSENNLNNPLLKSTVLLKHLKNVDVNTDLKIIVLDYRNNYVGHSN